MRHCASPHLTSPHISPSTFSSNNLLSLPKLLCSPVCLLLPLTLSLSLSLSLFPCLSLSTWQCSFVSPSVYLSVCLSFCLSIVQFGLLLCRRTMQTLIKLCKLNWIELNWAYFVQFINFLAKMSKCMWRAVRLCLWAWHALELLLLLMLLLVSWCRRVNHITIKAAKTHLIMTSLLFNNDNFATINHLTNTNARDKWKGPQSGGEVCEVRSKSTEHAWN